MQQEEITSKILKLVQQQTVNQDQQEIDKMHDNQKQKTKIKIAMNNTINNSFLDTQGISTIDYSLNL